MDPIFIMGTAEECGACSGCFACGDDSFIVGAVLAAAVLLF
jgi:hypothetical protein